MSANIEQRKLAAIMFTDMVGYSSLSQRDDKLALELLEEHRQLLREIFPRFNATEIKTIGDAFLVEILAKPDPALGYRISEYRFWLGWAQEVAGDHAAAKATWQEARSELESCLKDQPENSIVMVNLALTDMSLGDKPAALSMAERLVAMNPIQKDALAGQQSIDFLARVAARVGEPDRAIAAFQKVLSLPYNGLIGVPLTPALLRLDPMFDPLRNDPRFQKLCEEKPK